MGVAIARWRQQSIGVIPSERKSLYSPIGWLPGDHCCRCVSEICPISLTRLGQPDGISPSRMAEMLEVDKAGRKVRC